MISSFPSEAFAAPWPWALAAAAAAASLLVALGRARRVRRRVPPALAKAAAEGAATFRLRDGRARALDAAARARLGWRGRLGLRRSAPARALFAGLSPADPENARPLERALDALEEGGVAFRQMLQDEAGRLWELAGLTAGAGAYLTLRGAEGAARELIALRREARALREERDRLAAIIDGAPILMWRRDAEGRLIWANAPYRALAGAQDGTQDGAKDGAQVGALRELRSGDPRAEGQGAFRAEGRRSAFEPATGRRRWFDVRLAPQPDGSELGYGIDAAPIVDAEASLRRFVETLTGAFANLSVGLAIFDAERRLGLFNPAFADLMGLDPAWLASRPGLSDVLVRLRESRALPDQADFASWRRELMSLFDDPAAADYAEMWNLPGERAIRVVARPHPQGAVAFLFEDVTETARLERKYLTEVKRRRATMDRLDEAVAAFGPSGAAQFANPAFARVWGFRPGDEGAPARLSDVVARCRELSRPPTDGAPDPWDRLLEMMAREDSRTAWAQRIDLKDGRALQARFAPLPDGSILTAFTDITAAERVAAALRERNEALEAADEVRSALISQLSERLRRPLGAIIGASRLLLDDAQAARGLDQRTIGCVNAVVRAAAEVEAVILGAGDMAPDISGEAAQAELGARRWGPAFAALVARAERAAAARGVRLDAEAAEPAAAAVIGASARSRRIVMSLATAAIQNTAPGGAVRLGCVVTQDGVRAWTEEPASGGGEDRGLAHELASRLAESCGARIDVSTDDGRTRVCCALPRAEIVSLPSGGRPEAPADSG
ncbi:PAS-domain containing protein [Oceanicella actignis]|uniref:PAS-domain containing protein n=1 Tax=Oceanicella actignis TaxID=1189325 RepID=UPI0011E76E33|nr:PAS-domain containing protein [Oceanicella actignis]TYO90162.1 signal transduction histidine kinase [Oceanicella actignis]